MASEVEVEVFVVTRNPIDFPKKYVVRVHYIRSGEVVPGDVVAVTDYLGEARASIPDRLSKIRCPRIPQDDPVIVESWV